MQGSLAERLRVLRAQRGLTLVEAARKAGIGRDTLSDLERGRRHPVMPTLARIAEGYGVPVEELLEEPVPLGEAPPERGLSIKEASSIPFIGALPGLKAARERRGLSVEELSVRTGLKPSVISELESGERLADEALVKLLRDRLGDDCYLLELKLEPGTVDFDAFRAQDQQDNERIARMREELKKLDTIVSFPKQPQTPAGERLARAVDRSVERQAREQPEAG